jgi:NAD dependent epimerase/dehydratase family enzyme
MLFLMYSKIEGPVNLTSPNPVTNQEFTAALALAMKRPAIFPAPAFALRAVLGGFSTEVLGSKKVIPQVLMDNKFEFAYPHVSAALTALVD